MKTIEQKAKAYNEALERASKLRFLNPFDTVSQMMEHVFPELKEQEDERIRQKLLFLCYSWRNNEQVNIPDKKEVEKTIDWLEKQGETSHQQRVEDAMQEVAEKAKIFTEAMEGKTSEEILAEMRGEQKPTMIQWKGDNLKEVIDFTGVYKEGFEKWFHNSWEEYEKYVHEHNNIFKIFNEDGSHIEVPVGAWIVRTPDGYNTASRYVFRQKSSAWSEKDEEELKAICTYIQDYPRLSKITDFKRFNEYTDWLKSLKERVQPKQEWSEEDEGYYNSIIEHIKYSVTNGKPETYISGRLTDFLKYLKERVQLQPKREWSEEDERERKHCVDFLNHPDLIKATPTLAKNTIDWLKFLKDRYTWRPSEKQMAALSDINCTGCISYAGQEQELINLYNDLKRLLKI